MRRVLGLVAFLVLLAACRPPVDPPPPQWSYDDSHAAIAASFPEPDLQAVAECIAGHESGWWPYSRNGQYRGIFQISERNYAGTVSVTGDHNLENPYTNAAVARIILDARQNWSAWSTARACGVR